MPRLLSVLTAAFVLAGCGADASPGFGGAVDEPETEVSEFRAVPGTRFLLASAHGRSRSSYGDSYYGGSAVNHLFYDLDARDARWLFPSDGQRVLRTVPLADGLESTPASPPYGPRYEPAAEGPVRAFLYRVVSRDTNGDGDLDGDDLSALAVSDAGGRGYTVLVPEAERFLGAFWIDGEHAIAVYEAGGTVRGVEFDVDARDVTRRVDLPAAPGPVSVG
jgi:hypothetical protein